MRMESENATTKTARAATTSVLTSARDRAGTSSEGSPLGTGPVTDTPRAARSSAQDAAMPRTTRRSAPGIRLLILPATSRSARARAPTMTVAPLASPTWRKMSSVSRMAPSSSLEMPTSLPRLAEDQHDRDPGDVPHQDRLREVVRDPAEAGKAGHEEHEPHHDREHRCERGVLGAPTGGEGGRSPLRRAARRCPPARPRPEARTPGPRTPERAAGERTARR